MARFLTHKRTKLGFTLVELLIVVAIIGVLSTIGVPTFRRMVQKSKKSEAKVNLGGLYTAEQTFFSEYGAFGNNVSKIGFEIDGGNLMYVVGFPQGGAGAKVEEGKAPPTTGTCAGQGTILPAVGNPIGANINTVYPDYYKAETYKAVAGNTILTTGCVTGNVSSSATGDSDQFVASASGVIAPGISKTAPADGQTDAWTIDQRRVLRNVLDGVQ